MTAASAVVNGSAPPTPRTNAGTCSAMVASGTLTPVTFSSWPLIMRAATPGHVPDEDRARDDVGHDSQPRDTGQERQQTDEHGEGRGECRVAFRVASRDGTEDDGDHERRRRLRTDRELPGGAKQCVQGHHRHDGPEADHRGQAGQRCDPTLVPPGAADRAAEAKLADARPGTASPAAAGRAAAAAGATAVRRAEGRRRA